MKSLIRSIFWLNIDTAVGTGITSLFVAQYLNLEVQWPAIIALTLTILIIYNFDHIVDVKKVTTEKLSKRYRFYREHVKGLIVYEAILIMILFFLAFKIPLHIIIRGAILGVFTVTYFIFLFLLLPKRFVVKELIIAVVFTLGVFLVPVSSLEQIVINEKTILLGIQVFLLALVNTFVFAWYEYESDQQYEHTSLAIILGKKAIFLISIITLIIFLITLFYSFIIGIPWIYIITLEVMGSILFLSLVFSKYLSRNGVYRIVVESIFIVPLISLFFES